MLVFLIRENISKNKIFEWSNQEVFAGRERIDNYVHVPKWIDSYVHAPKGIDSYVQGPVNINSYVQVPKRIDSFKRLSETRYPTINSCLNN